jgi:thiamine-phosphate pyrophosphorylase
VTGGVGRLPRLHVVTDDRVLADEAWVEVAASVIEAGGAALALHVRGPTTSAASLHRAVRRLLPLAGEVGALLTVNDRVDVALVTALGAVHLGRRSLPVIEARRLLGPETCIGASCHAPSDLARARSEGADYAFVGTVFQTRSHPGRSGMGPAGLRAVVTTAGELPVLGIGGVTVDAVYRVTQAGAYGVAVLSGVWNAPDPARAASEYISALPVAVGH